MTKVDFPIYNPTSSLFKQRIFMHFHPIFHVIGTLCLLNGLILCFTMVCTLFFFQGEDWMAFAWSSAIAIGIGTPLWFFFRKSQNLQPKDGFLVVTLGWVIVSSLSALPYVISGAIPTFTDAFFEMMSGYTTTGATILNDIESLPQSLLFFRSFTHFLGGMGIIMLTITLLPLLGVANFTLYRAESSPGQVQGGQKIFPRFQEAAKWLWGMYIVLNMLQIFALWVAGMSIFDSICHAFGSIATAGFSNKNQSIAFYQSASIDVIITFCMFLGGTNFILFYSFVRREGEKLIQNSEFRWYLGITLFLIIATSLLLYFEQTYSSFWSALRYGAFQVVSIVTTTGFTSADYSQWPEGAKMILFFCMFIGASSGSTTSGIKIIQLLILIRFLNSVCKKVLQPIAKIPIRVDGKSVDQQAVQTITAFFIMNIFFIVVGGVIMSIISDLDFESSLFSTMATVWNIGPGFGRIGPTYTYAEVSSLGKWFLSFLMLAGRLDIFAVLVLLYPYYWKR